MAEKQEKCQTILLLLLASPRLPDPCLMLAVGSLATPHGTLQLGVCRSVEQPDFHWAAPNKKMHFSTLLLSFVFLYLT